MRHAYALLPALYGRPTSLAVERRNAMIGILLLVLLLALLFGGLGYAVSPLFFLLLVAVLLLAGTGGYYRSRW
jgi:hypothetical protein